MIFLFLSMAIIFSVLIFLIKNKVVTWVTSAIFLITQIGFSIFTFYNIDSYDSFYFKFDSIGVLFSIILAILSVATYYHSYLYFQRHDFSKRQEAAYYSALIMLIASMICAYFAENIAVLWVSIEATTLFVSVLIFHERTKDALEAAWKYLFISSVGVAIAFMGILFFSFVSSENGFSLLSMNNLVLETWKMDPLLLKIAFLLVLTGFSAKMGIFPLHTVTVDAHTVAPPPISAFISTTLMNVGFLGIFRIFTIISKTSILPWAQNVLLITGIISIMMSAIHLLRTKHFKRMFAFSSLENMGIVALGLAAGGIGYYAAILHLVFHSFVKASLFYQIGQVNSIYKSYFIKETGNYFKIYSFGGLVFIFCFISITAMPPSGLFFSEFMIFKALFKENQIFIGIIALFFIAVIVYVFGRNSLQILFSEPVTDIDYSVVKYNRYESISQYILLGLAVYLGINPPEFLTGLIHSAVGILK